MIYQPNFDNECKLCGTSPTVIVVGHLKPDTDLCGCCFFADRYMVDYERWNDKQEDTE